MRDDCQEFKEEASVYRIHEAKDSRSMIWMPHQAAFSSTFETT